MIVTARWNAEESGGAPSASLTHGFVADAAAVRYNGLAEAVRRVRAAVRDEVMIRSLSLTLVEKQECWRRNPRS